MGTRLITTAIDHISLLIGDVLRDGGHVVLAEVVTQIADYEVFPGKVIILQVLGISVTGVIQSRMANKEIIILQIKPVNRPLHSFISVIIDR